MGRPPAATKTTVFMNTLLNLWAAGQKLHFKFFLIRAAPFVMNNEGLWDKKYDNLYFINT